MKDFGEWLPDLPPYNNPGLITADNVLPGDNAYLPLPSTIKISDSTINGAAIGGIATRDAEEGLVTHNFIGTHTKLYLLDDSSFSDVSKAGGYTDGGDLQRWEFAQFGDEIIATNFEDNMQTYTIGTSTLFADLGGTPPKARHVARIGDFIVTGNINDSDGFNPQRVRWAGIGTTTSWTVSATTQADFQDLNNNFGWVQAIVGGEYGGVVFQERGIVRMTYAGSPLIFQFDVVNTKHGALSPGGVINVGDMVLFISQDGFYAFDGQTAVNIGTNKVNDFFLNDYEPVYASNISSALYPHLSIVAWSYRSKNSNVDANDTIIYYNYARNATKRFTLQRINQDFVFSMLSEGWTMDSLDNYPPGNQTMETLPYDLDSPMYVGNKDVFSVLKEDSDPSAGDKLFSVDGAPLKANLITGDMQIVEGRRAQVNRIRPYVDFDAGEATINMFIGARETLDADVTFTNGIDLTTSGYATTRSSGRYFRYRLTVDGTYRAIQGIDISSAAKKGTR